MSTAAKHLGFLLAQWKVNLSSAMAYRTSFLTQSVFMFLNDILLLFLWYVLLHNFPDIGGWGMSEIWLMYALSAGGYGLSAMLFGNVFHLSEIISEGQLDYYLALPKNALLHAMASRTQFSAIGDLSFGLVLGYMGCRALDASFLLFLCFLVTAALILAAFYVVLGSLAFFLGRSEAISQQVGQSVVTFGMYPGGIYQGIARFIITFVIPSAFMVHVPVELLRRFGWSGLAGVLAAVLISWLVAIALFTTGLRRYESGNQLTMRG